MKFITSSIIALIMILLYTMPVFLLMEDSFGQQKETGDNKSDFFEPRSRFKISGQYKNLFMFWKTDEYYGEKKSEEQIMLDPPVPEKKRLISDLKRLRISPHFRYKELLVLHADIDNESIMSSYNKSYEFDAYWRQSDYNDLFKGTWEPVNNRDIYYRVNIHRAYGKFSFSNVTLTLGRQQVRFGSGRLWNPLDILNPVSPTYIEGAEEQKAADAVRIDYYLNAATELTAAYVQNRHHDEFDFNIKNSNSIVRLKTALFDTDFAVLCGYVARRGVTGMDVAAILFDGMLRGSFIYQKPDYEHGTSFFQGNAGYEYTFRNGLYFLVEYFYNSNGLNDNTRLKTVYEMSLLRGIDESSFFQLSNQFITYNSHYGGLALGYDITPLLRGEIFSIIDFQGQGIFASPSLKYNIMENLDVNASVMAGHLLNEDTSSDFEMFHDHYMFFASLALYL